MSNTNATNQVKLTGNETYLLKLIDKGMDEAGCGWLHEITDGSAFSPLSIPGVLGSLIKKGLVESFDEREPDMPVCYWVTITEAGSAVCRPF